MTGDCRGIDTVPTPWITTILDAAYDSLINSWNIDVSVAAQGVVEGSVSAAWANVTANGTQSVPIGLVVQGRAGMLLPLSNYDTNSSKLITLQAVIN